MTLIAIQNVSRRQNLNLLDSYDTNETATKRLGYVPAELPEPTENNLKLYVWTQVQENYGAHAWDGNGECPQYWKFKGGSDVIIAHFTVQEFLQKGHEWIMELIQKARPKIESSNEYWKEWILDWQIIGESQHTYSELLELEYDGRIAYPARDLTKEAA